MYLYMLIQIDGLGQGHFDAVEKPTLVKGDIEGEKIMQVSSKADCVLAVSGNMPRYHVMYWGFSLGWHCIIQLFMC